MRPMRIALCLLAAAIAVPAAGAEHHIHFSMEHVPESAMDAHYLSLPLPAAHLEREWQSSVDFSQVDTRTSFIEIAGPMVGFAVARAGRGKWGQELLGFYSAAAVSGTSGRARLDPWFLDRAPSAAFATADFTNARGTFTQYGAGVAFVRDLHGGRSQFLVGALLERAAAARFAVDYRFVDGPSAGSAGTLDHSSAATFLTPLIAWQQAHALSRKWRWSPRALLALPLPSGDFDARLTGPGFDLSTQPAGAGIKIGDAFAGAGLAFEHVPSGISFDLGSTLFFAAAEHVSHAGVDHAFVVHVGWRRPRTGSD